MGLAPANPRTEPADDASAATDALLQGVRRSDFRFLLPDPQPREVAILGEPAPGVVDALRAVGARVSLLDPRAPTPAGRAGPPELVLARGGSRELVERAHTLLPPGGHLYVEADRVGAAAVAAAARRAGLQDVASHWHWPDFAHALEITPLDEPAALRLALSRRRSRRASRAKAWLAGGLARVGALQRLAPCVSVLARKAGPAGAPGPGAIRFLETHRERLGLARRDAQRPVCYVLVTPRFRASRHVVFLALGHDHPDPVVVAKLPRLPHAAGLAREAANLRAVALGGAPPGSVPRVVAFETCGADPILVETALAGRALDAATVRRDFAPWGHAVVDWLAGLGHAASEPGWFERLVEAPLDALGRLASLSPDEARAIGHTRALAARLRGTALPAVFEHGDLSPPNVLRLRAGGIGVLDWELADPHGLPAGDLFFFLTWAAWARDGADSGEARSAALERAFFGRDAWTRPFVLEYARRLGLPAATLTPLFVLTWARTLARFVDRLDGSAGPFAPTSSEWLRGNRYYHAWRHALARADALRWGEAR